MAWQQRVVDEKTELDSKRKRLWTFFDSAEFMAISEKERLRLDRQYKIMQLYSDVLEERILAWRGPNM